MVKNFDLAFVGNENLEFFFKVEKCIYLRYDSFVLKFDTHDWHSILNGLLISSKGDVNEY